MKHPASCWLASACMGSDKTIFNGLFSIAIRGARSNKHTTELLSSSLQWFVGPYVQVAFMFQKAKPNEQTNQKNPSNQPNKKKGKPKKKETPSTTTTDAALKVFHISLLDTAFCLLLWRSKSKISFFPIQVSHQQKLTLATLEMKA